MAKYDRRLLVPYLEDLCSVELLHVKVSNEFRRAKENYWDYQNRLKYDVKPQEPESSQGGGGLILYLIGAALVVWAVIWFFSGSILRMLGAVGIGFVCAIVFAAQG